MMSDTHRSTRPSRTRGERYVRLAWICVALVPVAFTGAIFLAEALLSAMGHSGEDVPVAAAAQAAGPALLLMVLPMLGAVWFGLRARRENVPNSWVPALVGGVLAVATVGGSIANYALSRIFD